MTDSPQLGLVNSVEIPYTSITPPTSAHDFRARIVIFAIWLALFVSGLVYVSRYALNYPFVDEWAFIPVLFHEEPAGAWLWQLHNEHRFPLPRVLYLGLFWLTGDLRTGCFVSFLGISLCAAGLVRLARKMRGRSSITDAIFPLLLMHPGQGENLYMGYQMCFMLVTVFASVLAALIVRSDREPGNSFRLGLVTSMVGWLLLTCGAAGLFYGAAAAMWTTLLATVGGMKRWQRGIILVMAAMTPTYIVLYLQGYHRPSHHPASAGLFESGRIALEAQVMAFGPAATGLWPLIGLVVLAVGAWMVIVLGQMSASLLSRAGWTTAVANRHSLVTIGLVLLSGAGAAVAFAIGWGRSGFQNDMGFAWRYGWITFPLISTAYFTWLLRGGRVSIYGPRILLAVAVIFAPVNVCSGFLDAEATIKPASDTWEADVRAGLTADEVIAKHFPSYSPAMQREMADDLRLLRDHRYAYYTSLGREKP